MLDADSLAEERINNWRGLLPLLARLAFGADHRKKVPSLTLLGAMRDGWLRIPPDYAS
jgi:hypothetical protein